MTEDDLLDTLLSVAAEQLAESETTKIIPIKKSLKETDIFAQSSNTYNGDSERSKKKSSVIHSGDTDSSDDEDNKYYEDCKYNAYGKEIKHLLTTSSHTETSPATCRPKPDSKWNSTQRNEVGSKKINKPSSQEAHFDPVFGLRIVNPLVSSTTLRERMVGREAVQFSRMKKFVSGNISDKNWVIGGVIVNKSAVRTSQKGTQFLIWSISDLKDDIKTVSMFLFGSAYKTLWKTAVGTVVAVLNPSVLDKKDGSKDQACLSVDNAQKVMILGQSKDLGTCKSLKKNGEQCTVIVNINICEFCTFHIRQEYQKCSKRSELQSSFAGKGLTALRNKVLGKNEVFYAGKLYTAIPAKNNGQLKQKDKSRLQALNGLGPGPTGVAKKQGPKGRKVATNLELSHSQRIRDLQLLEKLGGISGDDNKINFNAGHSHEVTLESSKNTAIDIITKLKLAKQENKSATTKQSELEELKNNTENKPVKFRDNSASCDSNSLTMSIPILSGSPNTIIDLSKSVSSKQINRAKVNALKYIQRNGPLKKTDPNRIKNPAVAKKRPLESIDNQGDSKKKKTEETKLVSERFKKIMEATSKHMDLLEQHDNEEQDKYFNKLEAKEKMEEKMVNTYKVACKAVRCLKCKYTNFSAAQKCKDEKHPLRVFDAMKRFFKCGNCGNRTVCLEIVPTISCNNCGSGKWERTGMMKEKTACVAHSLSIRGGEQTFVNSVATDANVNLLVPDEEK